jgi:hypothetical protein
MATEKVKRKLAAILSADVKGYSRLMGEDEEGTLQALRSCKEVMIGGPCEKRMKTGLQAPLPCGNTMIETPVQTRSKVGAPEIQEDI